MCIKVEDHHYRWFCTRWKVGRGAEGAGLFPKPCGVVGKARDCTAVHLQGQASLCCEPPWGGSSVKQIKISNHGSGVRIKRNKGHNVFYGLAFSWSFGEGSAAINSQLLGRARLVPVPVPEMCGWKVSEVGSGG